MGSRFPTSLINKLLSMIEKKRSVDENVVIERVPRFNYSLNLQLTKLKNIDDLAKIELLYIVESDKYVYLVNLHLATV